MIPHLRHFALMAALLLSAAPAAAQDAEIDVAQLGDFIRWSGVVTSLFVLAGAWFLLKLLTGFVNRFSSQYAARRLTMQKVATFAKFFIFIATGVIVIALSFRVDSTLLALIGGTVAVAVGFALKDLVASFVAGIMIIMDRPFQVGDRVSFDGFYGDITAIGLRSVRMQTLDDNTITIPNNKFLSDITSSGNYGALDMQVIVDFLIGANEDVDRAREILNEAALSSRFIYLPKPIVVLVTQVPMQNFVAVRLRLKAYVLDTKHEKAFETDITVRTLRAFREHGISPPVSGAD
ncbi:MAG: potassium transporter KefA [Croceicoccus sp.]|nr:potassium transporter KefA [Croceicoccus sp.]|tara:strand:+ start:100189 stop:101064 length:876 start_codon:yes stop_codon:yes gene_type:complete